jgi:hypothetical protein
MIRRILFTACAVLALATTVATAQQAVTGTVVRIDQPAGVIVLDNGQMYQATPQTVFLVNNQPTAFATIAPGTPVMVQHAQPVAVRDGRYVVLAPGAPVGTVVTPPPVVATSPFEVSGVVKYADPVRRLIRFDDGRNVSVDENVQLLANGSPVMLSSVRPGTFVVARSSKPMAFRDNTYYVAPTGTVVAPGAAPMYSGTVVRVDQPNTIVLSDGRVVPATSQTVVMVDNRPVPLSTLQPGANVVIYPNGQAAVVSEYPAAAPRSVVAPEAGLRELELERNGP